MKKRTESNKDCADRNPDPNPNPNPKTINWWLDYWRNYIGVETLPAISREKRPHPTLKTGNKFSWKKYQAEASTAEEFQQWKDRNLFSDGICILTVKIRHRPDRAHLYFVVIDVDKPDGMKEFLTRNGKIPTLRQVAEKWIVTQHKDNPEKAHFAFYSAVPFPEKCSDSVLGLEVRCQDSEGKTGRGCYGRTFNPQKW